MIMPDLSTDIRYIKGIGEKKAQALAKLGVFSLFDLVSYFPRRYEDRSVFAPIESLQDGQQAVIDTYVAEEPRLARIRKGMELVKFKAVDGTGSVDITYFNQGYVKNAISRGDHLYFYGKVEVKGLRRSMANPVYEKALPEEDEYSPQPAADPHAVRVTGRIVPIYRTTAGISNKVLMQAIRSGMDACGDHLPELIPQEIKSRQKLCEARYAYENIHFPRDMETLAIARRRMVFEELFVLACALGKIRHEKVLDDGAVFSCTDPSEFYAALPFTLTGAQKRAIADVSADLASGKVMSRLVQGDVGSGKTAVAASVIYMAYNSGYASAFMAPTEILASQHYATLSSMLSPFGLRIRLLTGSMTAKEKREVKTALKNGEVDLIIGTHALFSDDVEYANLGLVVTDEQHRFGVNQRASLIGKGLHPHVLVMSATPIPRTLALILYGDLDVSIIDELPPGRQKVDTFAVDESYRQRLNGFIRKQVEEGRQVFVVCPMVEENDEVPDSIKSAEEHAKELAAEFPDLRVSLVHGKMKPKDKDRVMADFALGSSDILVSTTVVEVGVDVPNASLMVIENAERFGLSQLHQLRGRVGRGKHKSWCILVSDKTTDEVKARLDIMKKNSDGFKISEEDLRLRGPGDFFGSRQHGLPEMHMADLGADTLTLKEAQKEADALLVRDPELTMPEHRQLQERILLLFQKNAAGFN